MTGEDAAFKKIVTFRYRDQMLRLRVAQELFSSHGVDVGTQRLLRSLLDAPLAAAHAVLDLGCGYGPIGLALKQADPARSVHLVDRDALAVEYTRQNAVLNNLDDDVQIYGSLGYADVRRTGFDLIASNIPAKAGEPAIAHFLQAAAGFLAPDGLVAIVIVSRLEAMVTRILDAPGIDVVRRTSWPGHTVIHYRCGPATQDATAAAGNALAIYRHGRLEIAVGGQPLALDTATALPETDGVDVATELVVDALASRRGAAVRRALLFNPGQGIVALAAWRLLRPAALIVVDRDLLALRVTRANLIRNGCAAAAVTLAHQTGAHLSGDNPAALVAGILRDEEGPAAQALLVEQAAAHLATGGTAVVAGSSTAITRLEATVRARRWLRIEARQRRNGRSVLVMQRA